MYQDILRQLQQLFSGAGIRPDNPQPGRPTNWLPPVRTQPPFISGNPGMGGYPANPTGPINPPGFEGAQPMPLPTPDANGTVYSPGNPGRGKPQLDRGRLPPMNGAIGQPTDMMYRYPPGQRPPSFIDGLVGSGGVSVYGSPDTPSNDLPIYHPGGGQSIPPKPAKPMKPPSMMQLRPRGPMPDRMPSATQRPVTGSKPRVTGGY